MRTEPFRLTKELSWTSDEYSDPIFYNIDLKRYFFFDETWSIEYGPYETEEECRVALRVYGDSL